MKKSKKQVKKLDKLIKKIAKKRRLLNEAIQDEYYEEAAVLRDDLHILRLKMHRKITPQ